MEQQKSFLLENFEEFCLHVLKYKHQIQKYAFFNLNDSLEEKHEKISLIQNELYIFIRDKAASIFNTSGKIGVQLFKEASYAMAAFADESFLAFEWEGKSYWRNNLLEKKIFQSMQAGEKIFELIEDFLEAKSYKNDEIGLIYYRLLALGFKGKYRHLEFDLQDRKNKLFFKIYNRNAKIEKVEEKLFPQAYENVNLANEKGYSSPLRFWFKVTLGLFVIYLVAAHFIWYYKTSPLLAIFQEFKGML